MTENALEGLSEKFAPEDIEWRIGRSGKKKDGSVWALALAYVTNRAIMERLDSVCGPEGWQNEFTKAPNGGVLCGISIKVNDDWITKWDGADNTKTEAIKGGLSGSMKRAGVQWGIGRYLYKLPETFVDADTGKKFSNRGSFTPKGSKQKVFFTWKTPRLPEWALPKGVTQKEDPPPAMDFDEQPDEPVATITEDQIITLAEILESKDWNVKGTLKKLAENFGFPGIKSVPIEKWDDAYKQIADLDKRERTGNGTA